MKFAKCASNVCGKCCSRKGLGLGGVVFSSGTEAIPERVDTSAGGAE